MKKLLLILLAMVVAASGSVSRGAMDHEPSHHGFLLFGSETVFADHIVNHSPHNWQVVLEVKLDEDAKRRYLEAKTTFPNDQLVLVTSYPDIDFIPQAQDVLGSVLRIDSSGNRTILVKEVHLAKDEFRVVYFKELPLSLAAPSENGNN